MPALTNIINLGFSLHQNGKLDDAENAYIEALGFDENNAEVLNLLGLIKLQKNDVNAAI